MTEARPSYADTLSDWLTALSPRDALAIALTNTEVPLPDGATAHYDQLTRRDMAAIRKAMTAIRE